MVKRRCRCSCVYLCISINKLGKWLLNTYMMTASIINIMVFLPLQVAAASRNQAKSKLWMCQWCLFPQSCFLHHRSQKLALVLTHITLWDLLLRTHSQRSLSHAHWAKSSYLYLSWRSVNWKWKILNENSRISIWWRLLNCKEGDRNKRFVITACIVILGSWVAGNWPKGFSVFLSHATTTALTCQDLDVRHLRITN